jgi:hypothetical protein
MADKDQAETQSLDKAPLTMDEQFDRGWDQVELLTSQENEAKAKAKAKPAETQPEKESGTSTSEKPFKVLKVQGKEIPVATEEEYDALASKGLDYTKKTQLLADDRRTAESQLREEEKRLADAANGLNATLDELRKIKASERPDDQTLKDALHPADDDQYAKVYAEFEIDPKYAQPHEVKSVKEIARLREVVDRLDTGYKEIAQEKANKAIHAVIEKERETYPYEDVIDDQGKNLTEAQLASIITTKKTAAEASGEKADPMKILKESVQEIHLAQKKTREALSITDQMDPDTFMKNYPGLAEKVRFLRLFQGPGDRWRRGRPRRLLPKMASRSMTFSMRGSTTPTS